MSSDLLILRGMTPRLKNRKSSSVIPSVLRTPAPSEIPPYQFGLKIFSRFFRATEDRCLIPSLCRGCLIDEDVVRGFHRQEVQFICRGLDFRSSVGVSVPDSLDLSSPPMVGSRGLRSVRCRGPPPFILPDGRSSPRRSNRKNRFFYRPSDSDPPPSVLPHLPRSVRSDDFTISKLSVRVGETMSILSPDFQCP